MRAQTTQWIKEHEVTVAKTILEIAILESQIEKEERANAEKRIDNRMKMCLNRLPIF